MMENPNKKLPIDYVTYPGKVRSPSLSSLVPAPSSLPVHVRVSNSEAQMDHATVLALTVGTD
jgi:hypothetical protein